jgi:hypothetical protein
MAYPVQYEHTQKAPLNLILYGVAAMLLLGAISLSEPWPGSLILALAAGLLILAGAMFGYLTVRDEGEHLAIRYGPIPAFRFRLPYAQLSDVKRGRSSLLDGWGVHWFPGRGTTFNLWGRDCVTFRLGRRLIRLGTDDIERLTALLLEKTKRAGAAKAAGRDSP